MAARVGIAKSFLKGLKSLPPHRQKAAVKSIELFDEDPSLNRLDFRQLAGRDEHFLINGSGGDRIILRRDRPEFYVAIDVGPHDNILRKWNR